MQTAAKADGELAGDRAICARPKDAEEGQGEHRDSVESRAKRVAGRAAPAAQERQVSGQVELVNNGDKKAGERSGDTQGRGAAGHADGSTAGQAVPSGGNEKRRLHVGTVLPLDEREDADTRVNSSTLGTMEHGADDQERAPFVLRYSELQDVH